MINRQKLTEELTSKKFAPSNFINKQAMLLAIIDAIQSQPPADQWTPVAEKLPNKEDGYLCFLGTGNMEVLRFSNDLYEVDKYDFDFYGYKGKAGFYAYDSEWGYSEVDYVLAWMPLPEPYKGVE